MGSSEVGLNGADVSWPLVVRMNPWLFLRGAGWCAVPALAGAGLLWAGWERVGWALVVGGGAIGTVFLLLAALRPVSLVLDERGMQVKLRGAWRKVGPIGWENVRQIGSATSRGGHFTSLLVTLRDPERVLANFGPLDRKRLAGGSQVCHLAIPLASQTHSAAQLAAQIAAYLDRRRQQQ